MAITKLCNVCAGSFITGEALSKEAIRIIKGLLPLNGYERCFYCGVGSKPDKEKMHFDADNVWGADRKCLMHDDYKEARVFIIKYSPKNDGSINGISKS